MLLSWADVHKSSRVIGESLWHERREEFIDTLKDVLHLGNQNLQAVAIFAVQFPFEALYCHFI